MVSLSQVSHHDGVGIGQELREVKVGLEPAAKLDNLLVSLL